MVRTGDFTAIGDIARATLNGCKPETLMKLEIERFVLIITYIAVGIGLTFFVVAVVSGYHVLEALVFTIGIIVANVPEGLLATVTVALTITAQQMAAKKVLVKTVETVETLGSVTVIASDKTGTLTQNRMTVRHAIYHTSNTKGESKEKIDTASSNIDDFSKASNWVGSIDDVDYADGKDGKYQEPFYNLVECAGLCNHAEFIELEKPILQRSTNGDASESALLKFAHSFRDGDKLKNINPEVACIPFNSFNKWMATIHQLPVSGYRLIIKGAPERVLGKCTTFFNVDKEVVLLTANDRKAIEDINAKVAGNGERVLAFGEMFLDLPANYCFETDDIEKLNFCCDGLRFVGMLSLEDPPRQEVPAAVKSCHDAGG